MSIFFHPLSSTVFQNASGRHMTNSSAFSFGSYDSINSNLPVPPMKNAIVAKTDTARIKAHTMSSIDLLEAPYARIRQTKTISFHKFSVTKSKLPPG
jgi:hypothetical protein